MKNDAGKCGLKRPTFHIIYSIESIYPFVDTATTRATMMMLTTAAAAAAMAMKHKPYSSPSSLATTFQAMSKFETLLENFNDKINFNNI